MYNEEISLPVYYILSAFSGYRNVPLRHLYNYIYRRTDRFSESRTAMLEDELDWYLINNLLNEENEDLYYRIKDILSKGDNGSYNPTFTKITKKDVNDIRVVFSYCSSLLEDGNKDFELIENKKRVAKVLKPICDKYKDFRIDVEITNRVNFFDENIFGYLGCLFRLWDDDIEPFMRLIACYDTNEDKRTLPKEFDTDEAKALFEKVEWCEKDGSLYKWTGSKSLFGYFVDKASDCLGLRTGSGRIPWRLFKDAFQYDDKDIDTARQAVNDYKNQGLPEPEGFYDIKKICSQT